MAQTNYSTFWTKFTTKCLKKKARRIFFLYKMLEQVFKMLKKANFSVDNPETNI